MTRVCVCCETDALRSKLAERLTCAGFDCTAEPDAGTALLYIPHLSRADWADDLLRFAREQEAGIVVLTKREEVPAVEQKLRGSGAAVFGCDVSPAMLEGALLAAAKAGERLHGLHCELDLLREKMENERIVSRAKVILVERRDMTESEAHRYIEKAAMDGRVSRRKIALQILGEAESTPQANHPPRPQRPDPHGSISK